MKLDKYISFSLKKISSKYVEDLNEIPGTIQLLGENTAETPQDKGISKNFLARRIIAWK